MFSDESPRYFRDRTFKRSLYERHGVLEYWLVDPIVESVTILIPGERGFELAVIYREGQTLTSPTLAGFVLDLKEVF